jgi:hypothetical protein
MASVPDSASVPSAERERGIEKTDELRRLKNARNRKFESISLQQRVVCEPDFLAFDRRALKAHPLRARCHRAYPATLRRRWPSSRF